MICDTRLLMAEDKPEVRRVERPILESGGYRVIEALDGIGGQVDRSLDQLWHDVTKIGNE